MTQKTTVTNYGYLFLVILMISYLATINYNLSLGYLVVYFFLSIFFVYFFLSRSNLRGVEVVMDPEAVGFSGKNAVLRVKLRNLESRRKFSIGFQVSPEMPLYWLNLDENEERVIEYIFPLVKRGHVQFTEPRLISFFPFLIFARVMTFTASTEVFVFPKPYIGDGSKMVGMDIDGTFEKFVRDNLSSNIEDEDVEDFGGLKTYQKGDSCRQVDWKSSMRSEDLYVKQFVSSKSGSIWIDWDRLQINDDEEKLSVIAKLVLLSHKRNIYYGLKVPGFRKSPDHSRLHKMDCLKALARHV